MEEVVHAPVVVSPLTRLMMCPSGDGASAAIVCTKEKLKSQKKAIK